MEAQLKVPVFCWVPGALSWENIDSHPCEPNVAGTIGVGESPPAASVAGT